MFGTLQFFGEVKSVNRALLGLVALLPATYGAWAQQSTVDDYFAAFDRARERLLHEYHKYPNPTKEELGELVSLHDRLSSDLEVMLRRIVGPAAAPQGFSGKGELNGEVWTGLGANRLQGISFRVRSAFARRS